MPTKQDYENFIIAIFNWHIKANEKDFKKYCYNNHEY